MPTAIEKALDFIGGMNTSASVPHSMDESTAKGILKYLHDLGVPVSPEVVVARGEQEGWNPEFTKKVAGWAEKVASGNRILIKNPEYFSTYMQEQLKERTSHRSTISKPRLSSKVALCNRWLTPAV